MNKILKTILAATTVAWLFGLPVQAQVTNVPCNQLPALTGNVTTTAGTCATTLSAGSASNLNSGTLANARMSAANLAAGNVNGGVTGVLPIANGGTNDTGTAWQSYTPTVTCGSGTATGATPTGFAKTIGKTTFVRIVVTTTTTTCASMVLGLPNASQGGVILSGRESAVNGLGFLCASSATAATCAVFTMGTGVGNAATNAATYTFLGSYDST